jgi:hypothetical protein
VWLPVQAARCFFLFFWKNSLVPVSSPRTKDGGLLSLITSPGWTWQTYSLYKLGLNPLSLPVKPCSRGVMCCCAWVTYVFSVNRCIIKGI